MLGFVKRWSKEFRSSTISVHLYTTFVRLILELGHLPWHNSLILPYNSRLSILNLNSLLKRRYAANLVVLYSLINHTVASPKLLSNITFFNSRNLRRMRLFEIPSCSTNYGLQEGIICMCRLTNNI